MAGSAFEVDLPDLAAARISESPTSGASDLTALYCLGVVMLPLGMLRLSQRCLHISSCSRARCTLGRVLQSSVSCS